MTCMKQAEQLSVSILTFHVIPSKNIVNLPTPKPYDTLGVGKHDLCRFGHFIQFLVKKI